MEAIYCHALFDNRVLELDDDLHQTHGSHLAVPCVPFVEQGKVLHKPLLLGKLSGLVVTSK